MSRTRRVKVGTRQVKRVQVVTQRRRRASGAQLQATQLDRAPLHLAGATYLTVPEAVEYLRFASKPALYLWAERHQIPKCRRGRTLLFLRRDLDEAVQPEPREQTLRAGRGAHEVKA